MFTGKRGKSDTSSGRPVQSQREPVSSRREACKLPEKGQRNGEN